MLKQPNFNQQGSSMLEVLVAIVVLSLGMLGLAALQGVTFKNNANANLRSQAVIQAYDILDRMRANAANKADYAINLADSAPASPSTLPQNDQSQWLTNLADTLPSGDGGITVNGDEVVVTIQWSERVGAGENSVQQLTFSTQI
jgi:type IV pilus assembly protein PilV